MGWSFCSKILSKQCFFQADDVKSLQYLSKQIYILMFVLILTASLLARWSVISIFLMRNMQSCGSSPFHSGFSPLNIWEGYASDDHLIFATIWHYLQKEMPPSSSPWYLCWRLDCFTPFSVSVLLLHCRVWLVQARGTATSLWGWLALFN